MRQSASVALFLGAASQVLGLTAPTCDAKGGLQTAANAVDGSTLHLTADASVASVSVSPNVYEGGERMSVNIVPGVGKTINSFVLAAYAGDTKVGVFPQYPASAEACLSNGQRNANTLSNADDSDKTAADLQFSWDAPDVDQGDLQFHGFVSVFDSTTNATDFYPLDAAVVESNPPTKRCPVTQQQHTVGMQKTDVLFSCDMTDAEAGNFQFVWAVQADSDADISVEALYGSECDKANNDDDNDKYQRIEDSQANPDKCLNENSAPNAIDHGKDGILCEALFTPNYAPFCLAVKCWNKLEGSCGVHMTVEVRDASSPVNSAAVHMQVASLPASWLALGAVAVGVM